MANGLWDPALSLSGRAQSNSDNSCCLRARCDGKALVYNIISSENNFQAVRLLLVEVRILENCLEKVRETNYGISLGGWNNMGARAQK